MKGLSISLGRAAFCLAISALPAVHAAAGDSAMPHSILHCAGLPDDAQRLACFDGAVAGLSLAPESMPESMPESTGEMTPEAMPGAAAATTAATAAAPTEAGLAAADQAETDAAAGQKSVDEFGLTPRRDERTELRELALTVADVRKRPYGELVVTMENGQVWTEKQAILGHRVKKGDTVIIRKGSIGGFVMITGSKRSSSVKRVE